ncbi:DUF5103 domain-containing protein [Flavobacterium crassostreae]|uniref:Type 9 secretion system plug protein N-terminal domain-containing protein n=1 Tax=Flavobacterium crassostreae TaxID=1763534 RepID=A0A1B9DXP3_9FLAO|nr:DUF5103 domain-containing protein [Flavobacterium crassostreae]OCB74449.1 hypothetical protein LPBF_10680 [Flavobacterium crassostreae]
MTKLIPILLLASVQLLLAQVQKEVAAPFNIKTITFVQNNQNSIPIFPLGSGFQLQFDDLYGNEADYYYEIKHCDYNWVPTAIAKNEYLDGFDNQRIQNYSNSFNTLQLYSHYTLALPNANTLGLKLSGNYLLTILNDAKEVVFSRKFILYEELANVPMQVKRARTIGNLPYKHNLEFSVNSKAINFQNPLKNLKIVLLQNGKFATAIQNIVPQYTLGAELIYKYDTETQFWAGNEFLFFENKDLRASGNNVSYIDASTAIYGSHLFTNTARANFPYSFTQDTNGSFLVQNFRASNMAIEADYAWVYFSLSAPAFGLDKNIYITGAFNNYVLTTENKMEYNQAKGIYEKALLIKQGFTGFEYTVADNKGTIDLENAIDGNFYQTENNYTALVYYKENTGRYDRVIGKGTANSLTIVN